MIPMPLSDDSVTIQVSPDTQFVTMRLSPEAHAALFTVVNLSHFIPDDIYKEKGFDKEKTEEAMELIHELATVCGVMPIGTNQ